MKHRPQALASIAVLLVLPVLVALGQSGATAASSTAAVTKSGSGRFSNLKVTVSQTTHLRNQVVRISWTGGTASSTSSSSFISNYLQIMQCWGDETTPQREKCQFGGIFNDSRGGQATSSREIVNNGQYDDPKETYTAPFPDSAVVPFTSVTGKTVTEKRNEFFDTQSTNEIPYARTANDGTGEEFFEVQTAREAAGLGCGARVAAEEARDCWLVVVPRDDIEVNSKSVSELPTPTLQTSPLSASNFENAISFRLDFDPVGVACPIGSAERRLLGSEDIAEAVTRWQPALCEETGSIFGFSQIGDDIARRQALTDTPWLSLVGAPLDPDRISDGRQLAYAPVAINGIGIGLVIERDPRESAPDDVKAKRGTRVLDLKLNARLVAKLLTQSYQTAVTGDRKHVAGNPRWLGEDKEFLALNPDFAQLQYLQKLYAITNPIGLSDANHTLWSWISADAQARAFVNGKPDEHGSKVNPYYSKMDLDRMDFPRSDPGCVTFTTTQAPLCSLDWLAYAADFHAAARAAIRGQTLATANWDWSSDPPRYKQDAPQPAGERAVLMVVDTATAARYQIPLASLKNGAGEYVEPTETAMSRALGDMTDDTVDDVLEPNPGTKVEGAYPLTQLLYALTAPRHLTEEEAKDYADFIRYAAGPGQTPGIAPGELPAGYVPLSKKLRSQAAEAADLIEARGGSEASPSPGPSPTEPAGTTDPGATDPGTTGVGSSGEAPLEPAPSAAPVPTAATPTVPAAQESNVAATSSPTPGVSTGATRFALLIALLIGAAAALAKPAYALASRVKSGGGSPQLQSTR